MSEDVEPYTDQADELRQLDDDIRKTMSSPAGRRFVYLLIDTSGFLRSSYSDNPSAAAFREGQRSMGEMVYRHAQLVCPELYRLMDDENRPKRGRK